MISLELSTDDAAFLLEQLAIHRVRVENELVHTDRQALQRDLAQDLRRLDALRDALSARLAVGGPRETAWSAPSVVR